MKIRILILFSLIILIKPVKAQQQQLQVSSFDTLSLQDLMNIKITVASIKELTARQSPGIISYITPEDIRKSGARDLMDVLQHIPGFEFGVDVEGVVGLAVRGNWAHEGKAVLLIDGQEMNDGLYSTLQFGNHYPVENIDRIEIIRGPGSAMYGGNAAYAVINVITRTVQHKTEVEASTFYSTAKSDFSRKGGNLFLGSKSENNSITVQAYASKAQRSLENYRDVFGDSISLKRNSDLNNIYINTGATIGKLGIRAIADIYSVESYDEYQQIISKPLLIHFNSYLGELNYDLKINDKLKIIPKFNFKYQLPWAYISSDDSLSASLDPFKVSSERYSASVAAVYDPFEQVNISGGASYFYDRSINLDGEEGNFRSDNSSHFTYSNSALFLQGLYGCKKINFIAGIRFNNNSRYSSTLVPRIGITTEIGRFHVKALYSRSFRSPSTENIDLSNNIKPEVTNVFELETGYNFDEFSYIEMNTYLIQTHNPIIYYFDTLTDFDAYTNIANSGTRGWEFTYKFKKQWLGFDLSASYYQAIDGKNINSYSVPEDESQHLGLSPFKGDASVKILFTKNISFSSAVTVYSSKYQVASVDENENSIYSKSPATALLNLQLEYHFKKVKGLGIQLASFNLLNNHQNYIQPYNSNHAPLPSMSREFQVKIFYQNF